MEGDVHCQLPVEEATTVPVTLVGPEMDKVTEVLAGAVPIKVGVVSVSLAPWLMLVILRLVEEEL